MFYPFPDLAIVPPDALFHLTARFKADTDPKKIDLGIGAYRDGESKPYVFPVVKKAEEMILADPTSNHEYLPIEGHIQFRELAQQLIFGADNPAVVEKRISSAQTISGTGAVSLGCKLLCRFMKPGTPIYISKPTWPNHSPICTEAGFTDVRTYDYYDDVNRKVDFEKMKKSLEEAPEGAVIILHMCAHNPTGYDPTNEQWEILSDLFVEKKLVPFFDAAYQGFASGDVDDDAFSLRLFVRKGLYPVVAQSFAKSMGLYGERIGALHVVTPSPEHVKAVSSNIQKLVRPMYSNPPCHGALIIKTILSHPDMVAQWKMELAGVCDRIKSMRHKLVEKLVEYKTPGTWDHIVAQRGMFSFTGLTADQCTRLTDVHHIYLTKTGRISVAGLRDATVEYCAQCFHEVITGAFP